MEDLILRLRENGPVVVQKPNNLKLLDHLGNEFPLPADKPVIALCRCGHSKNRPFCDGTHKQIGFQAAETSPLAKPQPPSQP